MRSTLQATFDYARIQHSSRFRLAPVGDPVSLVREMNRRGRWLLLAVTLLFLVAACLVLAFHPDLPFPLGPLLALGLAATTFAGLHRSGYAPKSLGKWMAGIAAVSTLHFLRSPSDARDWVPDQERTVRVALEAGEARIENLRNTVYREDGSVESRDWYSDRFRIDEVERVDYVHEILSDNGLVAHGFLSFAFSDGRHLAISVEARRRKGQTYHPLKGLFRNYELIYILGQETDLIGMRAHVRKNPVYVYPIRAKREEAQALFGAMLRRADHLAQRPEFYNTIKNNCVSNILLHVNELAPASFRRDLRILLPGRGDELLYERGLIDFDGTWEEARPRFRINSRSAPAAGPTEWSKQIRVGQPAS